MEKWIKKFIDAQLNHDEASKHYNLLILFSERSNDGSDEEEEGGSSGCCCVETGVL